jgi:glutathione-regulated potassium-efflux system ancillary protein KefC
VFSVLFVAKMVRKMVGVFPTVEAFRDGQPERASRHADDVDRAHPFGTISALLGLSHHVVTASQYSHLVAAGIGSAVIPTLIANASFMPAHLRPPEAAASSVRSAEPAPAREETPSV